MRRPVMGEVLTFKRPLCEEDVHHLAATIFKFLSEGGDLRPPLLVTAFRAETAELSAADLKRAFEFARLVVATFERLVVERLLEGDVP
jgi:hypothetical protein